MKSRTPAAAIMRPCLVLVFVFVLVLLVPGCHGGCAEVDSRTEAVLGEDFLLGCISCKNREEVPARSTVDWHFRPPGQDHFVHIFHYDPPTADILHPDFVDRLDWRGTEGLDLQVGAVSVRNVSLRDSGTYRCTFHRTLLLPLRRQLVRVEKEVELSVVAAAGRELVALVAEVLMALLMAALQLWLLALLVCCYRKTRDQHRAREARRALQDQAGPLEAKVGGGVQAEQH